MISDEQKLQSAIYMFNYYTEHAKNCWDLYKNIEDAAYMFDYYSEVAETYRTSILSLLY